MSLTAAFVIPKGWHTPSRWLSPLRATPPENDFEVTHPGRGATAVRPLPGSIAGPVHDRWYRFAQPPARIVASLRLGVGKQARIGASLRLGVGKQDIRGDCKSAAAPAEEKV